MAAIELREKLMKEISNADEGLLKVIDDVIENYNNHHVNFVSEPLSIEQYNREIDIAEEDIAEGNVFTQDEVSEMIKQWGKK